MMGWDVDETTVRIRLLSNKVYEKKTKIYKVYDIWTNNNLIILFVFYCC